MSRTFVELIEANATPDEIAQHLDGLDTATRVAQVRDCGSKLQAKLWELVKGHAVVNIEGFVGEPDTTVIYAGRNSLPVFSLFEKRFYRPSDGGAVVGYNHQPMAPVTGPGYFITKDGDDGELVFDYTAVDALQPPGWPAVKPNTGLLAGAVYGHMIDYNRFVSKDTVIGYATKKGKPLNQYYLLTRSNG